ncbi:MAG: hypothetical protein D4R65_12580 [Verrucomicrobiaceae bacterium]|nr:MAG: hypothetical protein D4R65_12580 [Verrucomicrobiaceae bacterium]
MYGQISVAGDLCAQADDLNPVRRGGWADVGVDGSTGRGDPCPGFKDQDDRRGAVGPRQQPAGPGKVILHLRVRRTGRGMENHPVIRKGQHHGRHLSIVPEKSLGDGPGGGEELLDLFRLWR